MSEANELQRQWVSLPHGSCDARIGAGATGVISQVLRMTTSERPRCLFVVEEGAASDVVESVRRELVDAGYEVLRHTAPASVGTIADASPAFGMLESEHITADDLVFALGGTRLLSLATYVAGQWCGGVRLATMPADEEALLVSCVSPRWLDSGSEREMVQVAPSARHVFFDLTVAETSLDAESSLMARALMVATAVAESERSFSKLWDSAPSLMEGNPITLATTLADALKSRGHLVSSTALAVRQSADYGLDVARALATCAPDAPASTLFAEALRISARISAGLGKLSVDDVFAQDDLLQMLGLPELVCDIEPQQLIDAIRAERFRRTRRFLLSVPQELGRVRNMAVDDDLLREHVTAWCEAHRA